MTRNKEKEQKNLQHDSKYQFALTPHLLLVSVLMKTEPKVFLCFTCLWHWQRDYLAKAHQGPISPIKHLRYFSDSLMLVLEMNSALLHIKFKTLSLCNLTAGHLLKNFFIENHGNKKNQFFGWFPHCNYNVKLEMSCRMSFMGLQCWKVFWWLI